MAVQRSWTVSLASDEYERSSLMMLSRAASHDFRASGRLSFRGRLPQRFFAGGGSGSETHLSGKSYLSVLF